MAMNETMEIPFYLRGNFAPIMEEATATVSQTEPGIFDIRSGAENTSPLDGTPYADW